MDDFFATIIDRWPARRRDYHWHVLPPPQLARQGLYEPYRDLTHREGIVPVSPEWYHLTLLHSAPVTEVADGEITEIIDRVRHRCAEIEPFQVTLDRPSVGSVAVECLARPGRRLAELRGITADETSAVLGERHTTTPPIYYPHVSLGYAVQQVDQRPLRAWLTDREPPTFTFPVTQIALVAQQHDRRVITWDPIATVPLATCS